MLTNLTLLTNLLTRNSYLWLPHISRQQSMHLFRCKMSRQLSAVDPIQQHLLTRRWHHQSRLIFCVFYKPDKTHVWTQHETKHDSHVLYQSTSSFQRLKNPTWPNKDVTRMRVKQSTMKQRLRHILQLQQHENQQPNNILSGDQPLQMLNCQLVKLK